MSKIIWIASYPRSGGTWARFLLANLLYKPIDGSAELQRFVPDIHRWIDARHLQGPPHTFIKTHWLLGEDLPLRADTVAAVYLVRNPLDVIASTVGLRRLTSPHAGLANGGEAGQALVADTVDHFVRTGGLPEWIELGAGGWDENVRSWLSNSNRHRFPRLMVAYEKLHADPVRALAAICKFLKIERSQQAIATAVERSSLEALARMEAAEVGQKRNGVFYRPEREAGYAAGHRLFGTGGAGRGAALLSQAQRTAVERRFGPLMRRLGYLEDEAESDIGEPDVVETEEPGA